MYRRFLSSQQEILLFRNRKSHSLLCKLVSSIDGGVFFFKVLSTKINTEMENNKAVSLILFSLGA